MMDRELGKKLHDGEILFRQGDAADRTYVITSGIVEVFRVADGQEIRLGELDNEDFFGEMATVEDSEWRACVRSKGEAQVMSVDKKFFLRKFQIDPLFAFRILAKMSRRIRTLSEELCRLDLAYHPSTERWEFVHDRRKRVRSGFAETAWIRKRTPVKDRKEIKLGELENEDFFGEVASVENSAWKACARSKGHVKAITLDKKFFLRKFHEDPSFAFRILVKMSRRIRTLNEELCRLVLACHPREDLWEFVHCRRHNA